MLSEKKTAQCFDQFKTVLNSISPLSEPSWQAIRSVSTITIYEKNQIVLEAGKLPKNYYFICEGVIIIYITDDMGKTYIKNILFENEFPAATKALLLNEPSHLTLKAIESCILIKVSFNAVRSLINTLDEFKTLYIEYLEKNWIIRREEREISLVLDSAEQRYLTLLAKHPTIEERIPQHYLASHLGITPTQLSRVRKAIRNAKG